MRLAVVPVLVLAIGCGFHSTSATGDDDGSGSDGGHEVIAGPRDLPHVPSGHEDAGSGNLALTDVTLDTSQPSLGLALPEGVTVETVAQDPSGPDLVVVHAGVVTFAGSTKITGSHPLVIIATTIAVMGRVAANATANAPGPGGYLSEQGGGHGSPGGHQNPDHDSGGGGGGFGAIAGHGGAAGADPNCMIGNEAVGGAAGGMVSDTTLAILDGGSGGARGSSGACTATDGGAGGGALQLSALQLLTIGAGGVINTGGGGGAGGCFSSGGDSGAGGGGGAGGAIYLDAPSIGMGGTLAANGGGGGGGGCGPAPSTHGDPGIDALATTMVAGGGNAGGPCGAAGGAGGATTTSAAPGFDNDCDGNGGGGGGSVGRIVLHAATVTGAGISTPLAQTDTTGF